MHILMTWWIWVLAGFLLLAIEMASTTMHVGFFGLGALVEGLIVGLGFGGPLWGQILTFTIVSLVALFFIRPAVMRKLKLNVNPIVDSLIGESAVAIDAIAPAGIGKAEMRGSTWSARNVGDGALQPGQRARVERVEGLTILIRGV
jgi:membrane protein implicated in regulation of membrane protease activity